MTTTPKKGGEKCKHIFPEHTNAYGWHICEKCPYEFRHEPKDCEVCNKEQPEVVKGIEGKHLKRKWWYNEAIQLFCSITNIAFIKTKKDEFDFVCDFISKIEDKAKNESRTDACPNNFRSQTTPTANTDDNDFSKIMEEFDDEFVTFHEVGCEYILGEGCDCDDLNGAVKNFLLSSLHQIRKEAIGEAIGIIHKYKGTTSDVANAIGTEKEMEVGLTFGLLHEVEKELKELNSPK